MAYPRVMNKSRVGKSQGMVGLQEIYTQFDKYENLINDIMQTTNDDKIVEKIVDFASENGMMWYGKTKRK